MPHASRLPAVTILIAPLLIGCQADFLKWERPAEAVQPVAAPPRPLSLVPQPAKLERREGRFTLTRQTRIECPAADSACEETAKYLSQLLSRTRGLTLQKGTTGPAVVFKRVAGSPQSEAYTLDVSPEGIVIAAAGDAGLFYGAVTLWQLASLESGTAAQIEIPALAIADEPRFAWRGVLLDSARHFQSPEFVKTFIDAMALHKLNVLQWHLTDDQGWRLEIRKYPRLTSVGAWRPDGKGGRYGGFYTQDEVRDIVAYARARNVIIVPEIEIPGHALSAIVAYPKLGSVRRPPKTVSSDWGVFPYLYNTDRSTFVFLENVLTEVMALFPGRYIHVGGDEAVKDQWIASRRIQRQMRRLGIEDADALQVWFTNRIGRFLRAHGRRMIGWDEILNDKLAPDAAITSWRTPESATEAAKRGHDVVLSPAPTLYFDYCQAARPGTPPCRGPEVSLKQVYDFEAGDDPHLIGVQANVWSERLDTEQRVAYAAFPRAAALAELGWTSRGERSWPSFLARLPAMLERYRAFGLAFSDRAFTVEVQAEASAQGARVSLANQAGFGTIRYTLDGHRPDQGSPVYTAPFDVPLPARIGAIAFDEGRALAAPASADVNAASILRRTSYDLAQCTNDLPLALDAPGATVMVNVMNPCWIYRGLDLAGVSALTFEVKRLPFIYQLGQDVKKIPLYPDARPEGQLEIRLDSCQGERLAVIPLAAATLRAGLPPRQGVHDVCLLIARRGVDPVWAIDWVQPVRE